MTNSQHELISKILDTNWELKEHEDNNDWTKAVKTKAQLDQMIEELNTFISNSRKMFASKN